MARRFLEARGLDHFPGEDNNRLAVLSARRRGAECDTNAARLRGDYTGVMNCLQAGGSCKPPLRHHIPTGAPGRGSYYSSSGIGEWLTVEGFGVRIFLLLVLLMLASCAAESRGPLRLTNTQQQERYPVWSPDGTKIALASTGRLWFDGMGMHIMDADGGNIRRPKASSYADISRSGAIAWSPDGSRIAFDSERDGNRDIYLTDADGRRVQRLTDDPANDGSPTWSPTGDRLAFSSDRDGATTTSTSWTPTAGTSSSSPIILRTICTPRGPLNPYVCGGGLKSSKRNTASGSSCVLDRRWCSPTLTTDSEWQGT